MEPTGAVKVPSFGIAPALVVVLRHVVKMPVFVLVSESVRISESTAELVTVAIIICAVFALVFRLISVTRTQTVEFAK
jgi:hypothetical protein